MQNLLTIEKDMRQVVFYSFVLILARLEISE
jgi:hypothetical protein